MLILAPTRRDGELSQAILGEAGFNAHVSTDLPSFCLEAEQGAGVLLMTDETIEWDESGVLGETLQRQPDWSDVPILLLAGDGADSPAAVWAMERLGNVTVLERPARLTTLISALRSALKARRRQYELRDRLEALNQLNAEIRVANRHKDEFLATLAHELRNPLAPIRNALHLLRVGDSGRDAGLLEMLERQVAQLVRLVDDLLEISRITRGRIELRKERVSLGLIVRSALQTSRPLLEAGRHEVRVDLPAESLVLDADPVRLAQVIANLLNNAAKYTEEGGKVELRLTREGGWAQLSVRDTGLGIPPEMLPRVFDMFTQVDQTLKRSQGGLGVGLTLARNLVELHGGRIEAYSEGPGRGSEFTVRLPLSTRPAPEPKDVPPSSAVEADLRRRRVLVVDDNHDAADSLGHVLRILGADVHIAYDGPSALDTMASWTPDAVLLDIGMPGMDGHEVAQLVRAQPNLAAAVLIAMTGWGQEEDRRRSRESGFDHHLVKPVDINALQELLHSLPAGQKP